MFLVYFVIILKYFITKELIIKKFNSELAPEIRVIIECCKLSQNIDFIKDNIVFIKDWDNFISLAYCHGIFPLVYKTLKKYSLIPNHIENCMKFNNMDIIKQNMLMSSELLNVSKLLEENQIKAISFKGPVLSQLAYGDVISRQYCDLDILVDKKDLLNSVDIFLKNGYKNTLPLEILSNEICLNIIKDFSLFNSEKNISVEIHWKLFEKKYDLFLKKINQTSFQQINLNNQIINTMNNEILLVYLCLHGTKHLWERIEWICDIDRLIRNNKIDFDVIEDFFFNKSFILGIYLSKILFDTPIEMKYSKYIDNKVIVNLGNEILYFLSKDFIFEELSSKNKKILLYHYKLNDGLIDKFRYIFKNIFSISAEDCQKFYPKKPKKYLYLLFRFYRLFKNFFS